MDKERKHDQEDDENLCQEHQAGTIPKAQRRGKGGEKDEKLSFAHPHPSVISPSFIMLVID